METYDAVPSLTFERPADGVLRLVLDAPRLNSVTARMHTDLAAVWPIIEGDDDARVVIVQGAGEAFSGGGSFDLIADTAADATVRTRVMNEARAMVLGVMNLSKPVISAMCGPARGAALAVGLTADISVAGRNATIVDGHVRLGVTAGDHAVLSWPLMCGMAKAKYYLLTCDTMTGAEAERIGLVSLAVDGDQVHARALEIAVGLSAGATEAIRATKQSLNHWFQLQLPAFEASLVHEFYDFSTPAALEGLDALKSGRTPDFRAVEAATHGD